MVRPAAQVFHCGSRPRGRKYGRGQPQFVTWPSIFPTSPPRKPPVKDTLARSTDPSPGEHGLPQESYLDTAIYQTELKSIWQRGWLVHCPGMPPSLSKQDYGLVPCDVREIGGLIFLALSDAAPPFAPAADALLPLLGPQGLERAKVAHTIDYEIAANWKVVWESNRECHHCAANHPEYVRANFDRYDTDESRPDVIDHLAAATARQNAGLQACDGLVHEDAVAGKDYQPETLLPFWQRTSEQDWSLCQQVQLGLRSSQYRPGPLSPTKEYNVIAFHKWYERQLREPN